MLRQPSRFTDRYSASLARLTGTSADYLRFCEMLRRGGKSIAMKWWDQYIAGSGVQSDKGGIKNADVVFVGGSLVPTGGHNILEPAVHGKPIVIGPYMHNFAEISAESTVPPNSSSTTPCWRRS